MKNIKLWWASGVSCHVGTHSQMCLCLLLSFAALKYPILYVDTVYTSAEKGS